MGAAFSLPFLEAMSSPLSALAAAGSNNPVAGKRRVRVAYLYFPNGVAEGSWAPERTAEDGELLELNRWMRPLEPFKEHLVIPTRLWTPRGNGHGAGTATWLTGGSYDRAGVNAGAVSVDQIAAQHVGEKTLLPSLELSLRGQGNFARDLPRNNISWAASNHPTSREVEPRVVFDRMFRSGEGRNQDRSVLDLVLSQAKSLRNDVSTSDRRKVDEYLDSVRAVERRITFAGQQSLRAKKEGAVSDTLLRPAPGIPTDHGEYVRLMLDLLALAFWSNATRVSTFMLDHGQSNRYFNFMDGVQGTWHALSHYKDISGKTEDDDGETSWNSVGSKRNQYNAVTRWHHEQIAYFLGRLKSMDDGDGTLLDNSMILYGSSLSDGHRHGEKDLPLVLAGGGGGTVRTGRVLENSRSTSLSRLHLSMLSRLGVRQSRFADAKDPLTELDAPTRAF